MFYVLMGYGRVNVGGGLRLKCVVKCHNNNYNHIPDEDFQDWGDL